ncbi:hypothetical protein QUA82_03815 [Microcoleus sp. F8-D3]
MKAALRLKLELGVRRKESGGKSQKEEGKSQKAGARISVFTNMRCSLCKVSSKASALHLRFPYQSKIDAITLLLRLTHKKGREFKFSTFFM